MNELDLGAAAPTKEHLAVEATQDRGGAPSFAPPRASALSRLGAIVRRGAARGVTLIEILIVLAIVGLIAGGIAVYAIPKFQQAQKDSTKTSAMALHQVAEAWRLQHTSECPTAARLKAEKELSSASKITDAWESPFKIDCTEDGEVTVTSFGPDKKEGTADDIRIPEPAKTE